MNDIPQNPRSDGYASATWGGSLKEGSGDIEFSSRTFSGEFSRASRFGGARGTNPEELLAGAQATCMAMTVVAILEGHGISVQDVQISASVSLAKSRAGVFAIESVELSGSVSAEGLTDELLLQIQIKAKDACPVSRALSGTEVSLLLQRT